MSQQELLRGAFSVPYPSKKVPQKNLTAWKELGVKILDLAASGRFAARNGVLLLVPIWQGVFFEV